MTAGSPTLGGLNRLSTAPFRNITSNGVPVIPGFGMFNGRYIYADAVTGNDTSGTGTSNKPVATLTQAYSLATAGNNDVIVIVGDGATTATQRLSSTLTWAKNATHLLGMTAPAINKRARISTATGATVNVANLINVTANGCAFLNFSLFQGVGEVATAEQLIQVAGNENYFGNVDFIGMGSIAGASEAASYTLKLYGGSENVFEGCYFGGDTRDRDEANTNVQLRKNASSVAATRNIFRDCVFAMRATAATPTFIDGNESGGVDRFNLFQRCLFTNFGTAVAAIVAYHASQGGYTIMDNCTAVNCTDWTAADTAVVQIAGPVPNGDTSGMAVASDKT